MGGLFEGTVVEWIPRLGSAIDYLPYFMGGYFVEEFRKSYSCSGYFKVSVSAVFVILSACQYFRHIFSNEALMAVVGAGAVYAVSYWLVKIKWLMNLKVYKCLLKNSMYIYLFHDPFNFLMLRLAIHTDMVHNKWGALLFFAGRTAGAIVFSIILGELIVLFKDYYKKKGFVIFTKRELFQKESDERKGNKCSLPRRRSECLFSGAAPIFQIIIGSMEAV